MIKIDRDAIEIIKGTLISAIRGAKNPQGLRIHVPMPSESMLDKAAMLALQSLTMDLFNANDVATPSDISNLQFLMRDEVA